MTARKTKLAAVVEHQDPKVHAAYRAYMDALGIPCAERAAPKWQIWSLVSSLATVAVGIVAGAHVANALAVFAYTLGIGAFLSAVVYVMAYLLATIASMYAAGRVAEYISRGTIATDIKRLGSWAAEKLSGASTYAKERACSMSSAL